MTTVIEKIMDLMNLMEMDVEVKTTVKATVKAKIDNSDLLERIKQSLSQERNHLLKKTVLTAIKEAADGVNDLLINLLISK